MLDNVFYKNILDNLYDGAMNISEEGLHVIAERCRVLTEQSLLSVDSEKVRVTVSIGAALARPDDTPDTVAKRVDQLMYHSKMAGRTRVSVNM